MNASATAAASGVPFAGPVDAAVYGEFRPEPVRSPRWDGRLPTASPGRFHVYGAWSSAASHRVAIIRGLAGLTDVVSMSYVDALRDGRGWAFREGTGADPVNGFTLLRQAYLASEHGYDGPVTVPVLWDRRTRSIVSTSAFGIGDELARVFAGSELLRPREHAAAVDAANRRTADEVEARLGRAVYDPRVATALRGALHDLDLRLREHEFLVGDRLTDADIRLWVHLVRYDAGPNAHRSISPRLDAFPHLWRWARYLHARPEFAGCTDLARMSAPFADLPPWPVGRPAA